MSLSRSCTIVLCLLCAVVGANAAEVGTSKPPIKVGAISSVALFPESVAAVRAYFDQVNAAGGIQGRRLQLIVEDDQALPEKAAQAARRLVESHQVVAHVGSASALECSVNATYYESQGLVSIQGTGADPACFASNAISPVNAGPYVSTAIALQFLTEVRRKEKVCVYTTTYAPVHTAAFQKEVDAWSRRTQRTLTHSTVGMAPTEELRNKVAQAISAGCEGVVYTGIQIHALEWMKAVAARPDTDVVRRIDWVFLTPAYTSAVAEQLASSGIGFFAMSEFEPWSSRSGMLSDWRDVMARGNVPRSSLSQAGYVAALVFVRTLRSIQGDIQRASVTRAFKELPPQKLPMMGSVYEFGGDVTHSSNRANVPVQLLAGRWSVAHWDYIVVPKPGK